METRPTDDCYALLGLDPSADATEVRRAWRRLALRWHPDRAGPDSKATFQKIVEAYATLSDPASRAVYDQQRGFGKRPAPSVMLRRLDGQLGTLIALGIARRAEDGVIELFLNDEEAAQGGMATINLRVPVRCSRCRGEGECAHCDGTGVLEEMFSAWLGVPPEVSEGTMLSPSVMLPNMLAPVKFRVRLRARSL